MPSPIVPVRLLCLARGRRAARRGAILPLVAVLLPALLALTCFVVNAAYMELTRTELRICSDAAARAAGYGLRTTGSQSTARQLAREAASRNRVTGKATQLANGDIVFGASTRPSINQRYVFTPGGGSSRINAVRVNARRDVTSLSGRVSMIMPTWGAVNYFAPTQAAVSSFPELDVALVIDRSGSMAYNVNERSDSLNAAGIMPALAPPHWEFGDPAPPGSRWLDLLAAADAFLQVLNSTASAERLTLVTYGGSALRETQLSSNYSAVRPRLDITTASLKHEPTSIGSGILEGIAALTDPRYSRPWAVKVMIVMTDGRHNWGADPYVAVAEAAAAGITVHTITFAAEADQAAMQRVADVGGGIQLHASTAAALEQHFRDIAHDLPVLLTQ